MQASPCPLNGPLSAGGLFLALLAAGPALGADILGAAYDAGRDEIVATIAYRGTHADHDFALRWGSCREGEPAGVAARLIDRHGRDAARESFRARARFSLEEIPCRPARVTLRLGRVSHATVHVPAKPAPSSHPPPGRGFDG